MNQENKQINQGITPEFINYNGVKTMFGLSRSHAYALASAGKIQSFSLKRPGAVRGKRLWSVKSLRTYIESCVVE